MYLIKFIAFFLVWFLTSTSTYACSCKLYRVEDIANQNNRVLTKLKIVHTTLLERLTNIRSTSSSPSNYKVEVLENIKGTYPYDYLDVNDRTSEGSCGVDVSKISELYVINTTSTDKVTSHVASVCNIVSQKFAESVRSYMKQPRLELQSVDVKKWTRIYEDKTTFTYADSKNIKHDEHGSYIWLLLNAKADSKEVFSESAKSKKINIQFACKEKKFNVVAEHEFSDYNANGFVVSSKNFAKYESYEWLDIDANYTKIMKITCK